MKKNRCLNIKIIMFFLFFSFIFEINGQEKKQIIILHTNDTHSQVIPTNNGDDKENMGGYARRLGVIDSLRKVYPNVLLLDAGDFLQGTQFFNYLGGRVEIDAMNRMKYDAATLGNHEFENGVDSLAMILRMAKFPFVDANYDLSATTLKDLVKPYIILKRFGLKIGIFGLSPNPDKLISDENRKGVIYNDPIQCAIETSNLLKLKEKCDLVICISHLGSIDTDESPNDYQVARQTQNIDVIIGGHSHTLIDTIVNNKDNNPVVLSQMGHAGLFLGIITLEFSK